MSNVNSILQTVGRDSFLTDHSSQNGRHEWARREYRDTDIKRMVDRSEMGARPGREGDRRARQRPMYIAFLNSKGSSKNDGRFFAAVHRWRSTRPRPLTKIYLARRVVRLAPLTLQKERCRLRRTVGRKDDLRGCAPNERRMRA